ncbi:chaperonin [Culex quinquefasciatus]|uniref:Chaperonin n=1 Tax=Culex quinquefasciatus TaxID=7176 RepID=B0XI76_CULQU|nr:chaperonin [Culex quinquefasciatus]|eukprot:XP_001869348.1 chaperonin [Culex quinquefasciatus]
MATTALQVVDWTPMTILRIRSTIASAAVLGVVQQDERWRAVDSEPESDFLASQLYHLEMVQVQSVPAEPVQRELRTWVVELRLATFSVVDNMQSNLEAADQDISKLLQEELVFTDVIALKPDVSDLAQHCLLNDGITAIRRPTIVIRTEDLTEKDVETGTGLTFSTKPNVICRTLYTSHEPHARTKSSPGWFKQSGIAMRNGNGPRGSPCWRRKRPIWHSVVAEPVLQERRQNISVVNSRKNKNGSRFWSRMTCPAFANLHSITAQNHLGRPVQQMEDLEAANISAPELAAETGVVDQKEEEEQQLELFKNSEKAVKSSLANNTVKDVNENMAKAWDGEPPEGGKPMYSVPEVLTPLRKPVFLHLPVFVHSVGNTVGILLLAGCPDTGEMKPSPANQVDQHDHQLQQQQQITGSWESEAEKEDRRLTESEPKQGGSRKLRISFSHKKWWSRRLAKLSSLALGRICRSFGRSELATSRVRNLIGPYDDKKDAFGSDAGKTDSGSVHPESGIANRLQELQYLAPLKLQADIVRNWYEGRPWHCQQPGSALETTLEEQTQGSPTCKFSEQNMAPQAPSEGQIKSCTDARSSNPELPCGTAMDLEVPLERGSTEQARQTVANLEVPLERRWEEQAERCPAAKPSADLRSDPEIADKTIDCLGLGISPEVDPTVRICAGCAERVDAQHAFRTVADEVQTVRDCLGVEINSWNMVTKICGDCVGGVEKLAEFSPTVVPVKLEVVTDSSDSLSIGSENGEGGEGFESDSSTADNGEQRGEKRKVTARSLPWIGSDHEVTKVTSLNV